MMTSSESSDGSTALAKGLLLADDDPDTPGQLASPEHMDPQPTVKQPPPVADTVRGVSITRVQY